MSHPVVTGLGCVSPFGIGMARLRAGLTSGRPSEPPLVFDSAGYRVQGVLHARDVGLDPRNRSFPERLAELAFAEAVERAGIAPEALAPCGLALASTSSGWHLPDETLRPGRTLPPDSDTLTLSKSGPALRIVEKWGLEGPHVTLSSACASSTAAIAWAAERIALGDAPVMAVGAVDVVTEVVFAGFHSMRLLNATGTRPFATDRQGFVLSEGAAFLVLEDAEHARARGAQVLATVAGWGASSDAAHITTPDAAGITRSLRAAVQDAAYVPEDIEVYHAHGTASRTSDAAEAAAVAAALRPSGGRVRVTATKSSLGHTEGAAGLFSAVAAVDAIECGRLPPVVGVTEPAAAFSAVALTAASDAVAPTAPALVHASGFGGVNCSVVLDRPGRAPSRRRTRRCRVVVRIAVRADGEGPALLVPLADDALGASAPSDKGDATALERAMKEHFARTPGADRVTRLLGAAASAALAGLGHEDAAAACRGGLLTGTAFGSQANHARMWEAIRTGGGRHVDPLDFARSTFNVPASQCSSAFGIKGRVEAFLGPTAGVEALLSAADDIASGRAEVLLAAGYDAPENRLWRAEDDDDVPAGATLLAVGTAENAPISSVLEIVGSRRLSPSARGRTHAAVLDAVRDLGGSGGAAEVWVDPAGLEADAVDRLRTALDVPVRLLAAASGAASPLDCHLRAGAHLVRAGLDSVTVVTTARHAPGAVVRYGRYDGV